MSLMSFTSLNSLVGITFTNAQEESPFIDVFLDHEYLPSIKYLKDNKIVEGYIIGDSETEDPDAERQFRPDYQLNRAELTKIMVEAVYSQEEIEACIKEKELKGWKTVHFPDVKIDDWFAEDVCIAVEKNMLDGYPDKTFKPEKPVNFVEASKIIANALKLNQVSESNDEWYKPFVRALVARKGVPPSIRSFAKLITRGEMARMIHAAKELLDEESLPLEKLEEFDKRELELPQIYSCNALIEMLELDQVEPIPTITMEPGIMEFDASFEELGGEGAGSTTETPTEALRSESVSDDSDAAKEFSTTNIQVEGVDEADIIKNDGKYIYLMKNDTIRIIEAFPAQNLEEISVIQVDDEDFTPTEMYIDEDQMVIIGQVWKTRHYPTYTSGVEGRMIAPDLLSIWPDPGFSRNRMKVYIYDISDRKNPKKQRSIEVEGNYSNSRKVGKNVYFVINQWIPYYHVTDDMPADIIIPRFKDSAHGDEEKPLVRCMGVQYFPGFEDRNYLIVAGLNIADSASRLKRRVLLGSSQNIYASRDNLYVAAPHYREIERRLGNDFIYQREQTTLVYRFKLSNEEIEFQNRGLVPGSILNQFSMDESRGHFRIATTRDAYDSRTGSINNNNLYVLNSDSMNIVGKVEEIAPGERIKSVRFIGNRGYMVTFKNVDPLFVIDLSEPTNPHILGKLKIPGWSDYLHPYDETHLIGFGREVDARAEESDRLTRDLLLGMKLSIFDVSDVDNPKETHKEVIGARGTTSEVLSNHKAVLFDRDKNLLAFPITITEIKDTLRDDCAAFSFEKCPDDCETLVITPDDPEEDNAVSCINPLPSYYNIETVFSGGIVYDIDFRNGFTLKGKVTHYEDDSIFKDSGEYFYGEFGRTIQRLLYIGEYLYSVSPDFVRSYDLDSVEPINFIKLTGPQVDDVYYLEDLPVF